MHNFLWNLLSVENLIIIIYFLLSSSLNIYIYINMNWITQTTLLYLYFPDRSLFEFLVTIHLAVCEFIALFNIPPTNRNERVFCKLGGTLLIDWYVLCRQLNLTWSGNFVYKIYDRIDPIYFSFTVLFEVSNLSNKHALKFHT